MRYLSLVIIFICFILSSCKKDKECVVSSDNLFEGVWNLEYKQTFLAADTIRFEPLLAKGKVTFRADGTGKITEATKDFDIYYSHFDDSGKLGIVKYDDALFSPFEFGKRTSWLFNIKTLTTDTIKVEYYFLQFGNIDTPSEQGTLYEYTFYK